MEGTARRIESGAAGARYISLEEKQSGKEMVATAALGFDGARTGVAGQLADPSSIGLFGLRVARRHRGARLRGERSRRDCGFGAFYHPGLDGRPRQTLSDENQEKGYNVRDEIAAGPGR